MNKEIKEISDIISDNIDFDDIGGGTVSIDEDKVAEAIYNNGYRKQVWHKVADGDLPEANKLVICFRNRGYGVRYAIGYVDRNSLWFLRDNMFFENIDAVLAWTELPEYKE